MAPIWAGRLPILRFIKRVDVFVYCRKLNRFKSTHGFRFSYLILSLKHCLRAFKEEGRRNLPVGLILSKQNNQSSRAGRDPALFFIARVKDPLGWGQEFQRRASIRHTGSSGRSNVALWSGVSLSLLFNSSSDEYSFSSILCGSGMATSHCSRTILAFLV